MGEHAAAWRPREAAAAWALLFASGVGASGFAPGPLTWPGSAVAWAALSGLLTTLVWFGLMRPARRVSSAWAWAFLVASVSGLVMSYLAWQPVVGPGADTAEALRRGAIELLHARSPWGVRTQFDNTLSPMLGGYVLAAPVAAFAGGMVFHQLAWLLGGLAVAVRAYGVHATAGIAVLFAASPWTRLLLPLQSDVWVTGLAAMLAGAWGWYCVSRDAERFTRIAFWASAVLFGVTMSYRFLTWAMIPPLVVALFCRHGWRRSLPWVAVAGLTTVILVLAPLVFDPDGYRAGTWAQSMNKVPVGVTKTETVLLIVAPTLVVLALTTWRSRTLSGVWGAATLTLMTLWLAMVLSGWLVTGQELSVSVGNYRTVAYNGMWLVMGLAALSSLTARPPPSGSTPLG